MEFLGFWWKVIVQSFYGTFSTIGKDPADLRFSIIVFFVVALAVFIRQGAKTGWENMTAKLWTMVGEDAKFIGILILLIFVLHLIYKPYALWKSEHSSHEEQKQLTKDEHDRLIAEQDKSKPNFRPMMEYSPSVAQPHNFPGAERSSAITILMRLENLGAPSITQSWRLRVVLPDGTIHSGIRLIPSFKTMSFSTDASEHNAQMKLRGKDQIEEKTAEIPVERGGSKSGYIIFIVKDVHYLVPRQKGTKIIVGFNDITGRPYEMEYTMSGGPGMTEPIYVPGLTHPH